MTRTPMLYLTDATSGQQLGFRPERVVLAGYTGRDRASVEKHIEELKAHGVPAPNAVPVTYPGLPSLLQIDGSVGAAAGWSSGEVEYVLLTTEHGVYVGIGSDHTDRDLERTDMIPAKQAFPKILGERFWPLERLAAEWDSLTLRSWVARDGVRALYQEGSVGLIMGPKDLLAFAARGNQAPGLIVYSGTMPAVEPAPMTGACLFEGELARPDGSVLATVSYQYEAGPRAG
jgi:hypothetical protein